MILICFLFDLQLNETGSHWEVSSRVFFAYRTVVFCVYCIQLPIFLLAKMKSYFILTRFMVSSCLCLGLLLSRLNTMPLALLKRALTCEAWQLKIADKEVKNSLLINDLLLNKRPMNVIKWYLRLEILFS